MTGLTFGEVRKPETSRYMIRFRPSNAIVNILRVIKKTNVSI